MLLYGIFDRTNFDTTNIKISAQLCRIKFDESLCFNSQVEFIRSRCQDRLNIIKILSHKSWKLNDKTLAGILKKLFRSQKRFDNKPFERKRDVFIESSRIPDFRTPLSIV
ncbi:hypothetical protein BpHYR1_000556 [Brachionus plicatilis]|uniref:RNA-directed DNA polymerase from mobile element jockey-like n=1 Tax=Brachionus plicatilis TaxID=10195 RepID=A0A3M7R489_BRAPC|nr:hypothetical protein BpHYR1_000556 [Brachionus plicatilis]